LDTIEIKIVFEDDFNQLVENNKNTSCNNWQFSFEKMKKRTYT